MIHYKNWIVIIILFLILQSLAFTQSKEYLVKAVFLERFTRFIEWPEESAISDTSKPFVLGVIGENPFGSILEQLYATQKIKNKKVMIRYISDMNQISDCNLLFIAKSENKRLSEILSLTKEKAILTISDTGEFAAKGVLINLYIARDNINFEINEKMVRKSGLRMSYLLLKEAKITNPTGENP